MIINIQKYLIKTYFLDISQNIKYKNISKGGGGNSVLKKKYASFFLKSF